MQCVLIFYIFFDFIQEGIKLLVGIITIAGLLLGLGTLGDRLGHKKLFVMGLTIFGLDYRFKFNHTKCPRRKSWHGRI